MSMLVSSHVPLPPSFSAPLHSSITSTRVALDRFLNARHSSLSSFLSSHGSDVQSKEAKLSQLLKALDDVTSSGKDKVRDNATSAKLLSDKSARVEDLAAAVDALESTSVSLSLSHSSLSAAVAENAASLEKDCGKIDDAINSLNTARDMYRDALGLTFERAAGARLRLSFSSIASTAATAKATTHMFVLDLDASDKYVVEECVPSLTSSGVDEIKRLTSKVNADNDFGEFVRGMRKAFVRHEEERN